MLPLAASDTATALITVLAVLIGGCLALATDLGLAIRRERAEGRAGARLVQEDLRQAAEVIADCLRTGRWLGPVSPTSPAWNDFRPVLASVLAESAWRRVVAGVGALRQVDGFAAGSDALTRSEPPLLGNAVVSLLKLADQNVLLAYNALADLAGAEQETELATPDPRDAWTGE